MGCPRFENPISIKTFKKYFQRVFSKCAEPVVYFFGQLGFYVSFPTSRQRCGRKLEIRVPHLSFFMLLHNEEGDAFERPAQNKKKENG